MTEKLQSKATTGSAVGFTGIKTDDHAATVTDPVSLNAQKKAEDRLSTGSGGSAVIDMEGANHLVDSSEESYFPENYHCMVDDRVHSEEDDGSDEGCNYYSDDIFTAEHQQQHHHHQHHGEDSQLGWFWT